MGLIEKADDIILADKVIVWLVNYCQAFECKICLKSTFSKWFILLTQFWWDSNCERVGFSRNLKAIGWLGTFERKSPHRFSNDNPASV